MGAWGGGVYESDNAMDFVVGKMVNDLKLDDNFNGPRSEYVARARRHFDDGHFTRVFNEYQKIEYIDLVITGPQACIVLAAKAMNLGATISDEQRPYLRSVYKKCGLHKEGIEQIGKALDEYINGTPYELIEPDRTDHNIRMAFDSARANTCGGFGSLNYQGPRYYQENVPSWDLAAGMLRAMRRGEPAYFRGAPVLRECAKCNKLPEQVEDGLKACGGCKKVMYCGRDCQKKNWATHKKFCKTFAAMPAPPSVQSLEKSPMCVPGYDPLAAACAENEAKPPGTTGKASPGASAGKKAGVGAATGKDTYAGARAGTANGPQCPAQ